MTPDLPAKTMKRRTKRVEPLVSVAAKDVVTLISRRLLAHTSFNPRHTRSEEWAGIPLLRRLAADSDATIDDFPDDVCQAITQHLLRLCLYPALYPTVFDKDVLIGIASREERTRALLTRIADDLELMADLTAKSPLLPRS